MTDNRFDDLMRDAAETYRKPPEPDFDAMWKGIEAAHFGGTAGSDKGPERQGFRFVAKSWMGIAATLILGIGIGRASGSFNHTAAPAPVVQVGASVPSVARADTIVAGPYGVETSQYLGQTAALLIALPSEMKAGRADEQFLSRAGELLTRTRLLIDSPAASDPSMRSLLEDLEMVLAQVVRLQSNSSHSELDLINRALEQRDVIPRLRTAVADISAN